VYEVEVFLCFETPEKKIIYLNSLGLLSVSGSASLEKDLNDYINGLVLNTDDFWLKYDEYDAVKNKADALAFDLRKTDSKYTIEYFKN